MNDYCLMAAFISTAPAYDVALIAELLRDRLYELSEAVESDEIGDNGAAKLYQAGRDCEEAASTIRSAIVDKEEYSGRKFNAERDQGENG